MTQEVLIFGGHDYAEHAPEILTVRDLLIARIWEVRHKIGILPQLQPEAVSINFFESSYETAEGYEPAGPRLR